jgi:predicted ATPase/class 3 adenylate cyclase
VRGGGAPASGMLPIGAAQVAQTVGAAQNALSDASVPKHPMPRKPRAASPLPTGTVTFLFTDIEGSTRLWESQPAQMRVALARHDTLLHLAIADNGGFVFKTVGDAFCAAFAMALDAVAAVLAAQLAIRAERWPTDAPIKVRMALHTGAVERVDGDYFGPPVNRVARLLSTGHGGQTLLAQTTCDLCRDCLPDATSLRDLGVHQLKDLARPERVFQLQHPGLPTDFPPLRSLSTHPNNLPQQLTSFIGREKEITQIEALLAGTHVLTLTGSGGSGKTRLCLQVAAESLEQFPDGAWFVELASLADPGLVPQTVATVLQVKEVPGKAIAHTLSERLRDKRLLLLLDNCEHVLDECAKLASALARQCPDVRILATSREALGISGEQTYRVPSLALPDRRQTQTPQTLSLYESVQLFIDRALLVRADFAITIQNARALASLCCHLDGIPLAIELAAARIRSLSVEEIDGRLDQRFRLLTGGSRTALPRQQTLRSLIDWSYDLLREPERLLLQRLSVFAGGWTLAAAEQVCVGDGVADVDVLDLLTSLSDKSLVVAEQRDEHSRYRLLETVRQYARDRLLESGGTVPVRERHRDHFLALALEAEPKLLGAQQAAWLQHLEVEHENLRAALDGSLGDAASETGLRLCAALQRFWWTRGHLAEGREWCARFLARAGDQAPTLGRGKVLNAAGVLAYHQGDYAAARARHEEGLAIWRHLGGREGVASSLNNLGNVTYRQGDFAAAQAMHEEGLAIWRESRNRSGMAASLGNLGILAWERNDLASARALLEECLAIVRELGDRGYIANSLQYLANVAHSQDDYPAARARHGESLAIRRELGDKRGIAYSLEGLAAVDAALGGSLRAARIWSAAQRLRVEIGSPVPPNERPRYEQRVSSARTALRDDAAFDRAWQEGGALTLEEAIALASDEAVERP